MSDLVIANYETPSTLYRGVVISSDKLTQNLLEQDIVPQDVGVYDPASGRTLRHDGNEWGVYMTTYQHMAEVAYGNPRIGDTLPDMPTFPYRGESHARVEVPRVGLVYEIATAGLAVREPFIDPIWYGHYNNGFVGREYIADRIPRGNYHIARLTLGPDTLHDAEHYRVANNEEEIITKLRQELATRIGRITLLATEIAALSEKECSSYGVVERIIRQHRASIDSEIAQG